MNLWQRITGALSSHPDSQSLQEAVGRLEAQLAEQASEARARQELLEAVVDAAPVAMVLLDEVGSIVFANAGARELFFESQPPEGKNFLRMLASVPAPLRSALLSDADHLFSFENAGESETYHLAKRHVTLGSEQHSLLIVRHMTLELARQENAVLRKAIRVIHHEFANSLTPVISLLRSARARLGKPDSTAKLEQMLSVIEERVQHLNVFLSGFAALGRLPKPRLQEVSWEQFLGQLRPLLADICIASAPSGEGWFDPTQIQQVVINLVKNAREAGSPEPEITLEVVDVPEGGHQLRVLDRGAGMSAEVLENAMVPSFTTRPQGSGMGLALCREIADAHQGQLRIARREGGGVQVTLWLPPRNFAPASLTKSRARLSLSRV